MKCEGIYIIVIDPSIFISLTPFFFCVSACKYSNLLNSQPWIMHFAYSDWFTQSWLSAHIP